jgi:hypothetical protein
VLKSPRVNTSDNVERICKVSEISWVSIAKVDVVNDQTLSQFLLFIFYFPILEELITYFSYCTTSINNILLVVICHSFLVVSGFLGNRFNLHFLFNFSFFTVVKVLGNKLQFLFL